MPLRKYGSDLGISVGSIAATGIKLNRLIAQKSGYDAIMEMYTQASKTNGKKYIPVMDGIKLSVIRKGENGCKLHSEITVGQHEQQCDQHKFTMTQWRA